MHTRLCIFREGLPVRVKTRVKKDMGDGCVFGTPWYCGVSKDMTRAR